MGRSHISRRFIDRGLLITAALGFFLYSGMVSRGFLLVSSQLESANYENAAKFAVRASRYLNPGIHDLHFSIGKQFKRLREYDDALREFRVLVDKNPSYPGAHLEIGRFASLRMISMQEAVEHYTAEIEISNHRYAYHMRGLMYGFMREWGKAEQDFRTETTMGRFWGAHIDLAWALLAQNKLEEAEKEVMKALEIDPDLFWGLIGAGVIALEKEDYAVAVSFLRRAVERGATEADYLLAYPGNNPLGAKRGALAMRAGAHFNLALAYERSGRPGDAILQYGAYINTLDELEKYEIGPDPPAKREDVENRIALLQQRL